MTCDDFRRRLETARLTEPLPDAHREHSRSCTDCSGLLEDERLWRRFFSAASEPTPGRPAWPGVAARIREEEDRRASLSDALLLFSRRLAPAFALVAALLAGVGLWQGMATETRTPALLAVALLENPSGREASLADEPDAVLVAWVGDRNP